MKNLNDYLNTIKFDDTKQTIINVTSNLFEQQLASFDYQSQLNGLLLGDVQSGKTGQMFGILAAAVDKEFDLFLVLTTDNTRLQQQTFKRALESFPQFCVCGESDSIRFTMNKMRIPVVIILKKNSSVLKKWRNYLLNSKFLTGRTLFLIDDEADAASLNAKVNQNEITAINQHIRDIRNTCASCIYLQVTATPQAVLLQTDDSEFKPSFVIYFEPGKSYLGGDFFFSKPEPYCIIETDDNMIQATIDPNADTYWLNRAILNFLVVAAQFKLTDYSSVCNFLIHPSVKTRDHTTVAEKIGEILNEILQGIIENEDDLKENLMIEWKNLYTTKPEIKSFEIICDRIREMLFHSEINIHILNSKSNATIDVETGYNIVIGGNILGRGVTFPNLQTVYYSRTAKTPQADTYWQHCRMFGYDRDRSLIRLFMPFSIFKLFQELNESQKALIKQISVHGIDEVHLLYANGIRPTRNTVINSQRLSQIVGGVNYFAAFPVNKTLQDLDSLLLPFEGKGFIDCPVSLITDILLRIGSEDQMSDWNSQEFINAVNMVTEKERLKTAKLFVSVGRRISKGKGTMLSENDRVEIDKYNSDIALIMYRMIDDHELGWNGSIWMPNIKLPEGFTLFKIQD
ncbi:MAG: Z1 domain-containing protein [Fibromonadales bacterium]|nr:Z1 domain-containing protein [Fibromonadales bacterium]